MKTAKKLMVKAGLGLLVISTLGGCRSEDNSHNAISRQYQELEFAYNRCLGDLRFKKDVDTFDQRLACTQAVYGGGQ